MALIKCSKCGSFISDKAKACPKCGAENKPEAIGYRNLDRSTWSKTF